MGIFGPERSFIKAAGRGDLPFVTSFISDNMPDTFTIDVKGAGGMTALMAAAAGGRLDVIAKLIEKKASLEATDDYGRTALYHAVQGGRTEAAKALLAAGANAHTHDNDFYTPLIRAAENGDLAVVKMLVGANVDVNATTKSMNNTALIRATENKRVPVMEFLILSGARPDLKDATNRTAFDYAKNASLPIEAMIEAAQKAVSEKAAAPASIAAKDGRERLIITENLKTGAETLGQPEKFDTVAGDIISRAEAAKAQFARKTFQL